MKKSLIALAVLVASGAAMAQSSVTLYGIADVVIHKDKDASARMSNGGVSTSRWGIKGSEDLGGGVSANFNYESKVDLTNGASGDFTRQAWLGLSGGFGAVKLGKFWNAYDDVAGASNPVFDSVLSPAGIAPSYNYIANPNSGVYYSLPSMGGFGGAVSTNFKSAAEANLRATAFNVNYGNGPVFVALGYQVESMDGMADRKLLRVNGSYDLGAAKILAAYGNEKEADSNDFTVGVDVPFGQTTLSAGYTMVRPDAGDDANSFGVAVAYSLSKRTTVYAGFRKDNDAAVANYGGVESRIGAGIKHTF
ncbi:porin [Hydrogenophaga sp. 5NK40-0174]|uniref:porin n=1 Tax=Hydrogenophaga sp. 5NK40-0174 TaxID=3127649 RepID=UPI0031054845